MPKGAGDAGLTRACTVPSHSMSQIFDRWVGGRVGGGRSWVTYSRSVSRESKALGEMIDESERTSGKGNVSFWR